MIQDVINRAANSLWPQISLVIFILCFVGVLIWTYRGNKDRFRSEASLPLDEQPDSETWTGNSHG